MNTFTKVLLSVPLLLSTVACSSNTTDFVVKSGRLAGSTVTVQNDTVQCHGNNPDRGVICSAAGTQKLLNGDVHHWSSSQWCYNSDYVVDTYDLCRIGVDQGQWPEYRHN